MKLIQTPEEIQTRKKKYANGFMLDDVNMVIVFFKTDHAIIKQILPPPLTPGPEPLGYAYVAEFQKTNFGIKYNEAALFIQAQYKDEIGNYCLSMPVDNDIAMAAGREVYGYPKKIAGSITLTRQGNHVKGTCIRRGIPIIEITADIQAPFPEEFTGSPHFVLKAFPSLDAISVDDHPRLIRHQSKIDYGPIEIGSGTLTLQKSHKDLLHEIPVNEVTMTAYTTQTTIWMQPATLLEELKPKDCHPYVYIKYDQDM
jgi:acetoacetate decarboxylase